MKKEKYIIFDSSALINMISNGLFDLILKLKKEFAGHFIITPGVKHETLEHPKKIQRFEWGAVRIEELISLGVLEEAKEFFNEQEIIRETQKMLLKANNMLYANTKPISLVEEGEIECLALSKILNEKGIENISVIDERTARLLVENPENLKKIIEQKVHSPILIKGDFSYFQNIKIIRSTELAFIAIKKQLLEIHDKDALEALLYALKFGGASITEKEIQVMKKS